MRIFLKELILALTAVAGGILSFWMWKETVPLLTAGLPRGYSAFFAPVAALAAGAALFSLAAIFIETNWLRYAAPAVLAGMPFFLTPASYAAAAAGSGAVLLSVFAGRRIHKEHILSLGFSTSQVLKSGLPIFFTAASLIAAWFYLAALKEQHAGAEILIPKPVSDLAIRIFSGPLKESTGLSEIGPDITVDDLLTTALHKQIRESGAVLGRNEEQGLAELLAHQRDQLGRQYGIPLKGDETLGQVLNQAVAERLGEILGPYAQYLPAISALTFFFAFKAFTFPLYFITLLEVSLLIRLLQAVKIITRHKEQLEVERLTL